MSVTSDAMRPVQFFDRLSNQSAIVLPVEHNPFNDWHRVNPVELVTAVPFYQISKDDASEKIDRNWDAIDRELNSWLVNPSLIADPEAIQPSREIIRQARVIAARLKYDGNQSPTMVVPDNVGGISFEFHQGALFTMLSITPGQNPTVTFFQGGRFMSRGQLML